MCVGALYRSRLAIIPQDPFLFSGTIRENLDPCGRHQDEQLLDVVDQCHLSSVVTRMGEGLTEGGGDVGVVAECDDETETTHRVNDEQKSSAMRCVCLTASQSARQSDYLRSK